VFPTATGIEFTESELPAAQSNPATTLGEFPGKDPSGSKVKNPALAGAARPDTIRPAIATRLDAAVKSEFRQLMAAFLPTAVTPHT
jgi:hypothetical protein